MIPIFSEAVIDAEACIIVNRTIDDVFCFVAKGFVANCPKWSPEVSELVLLSDGPLVKGSRLMQRRSGGSGSRESELIITDLAKNSSFGYAAETDSYVGNFEFEVLNEGKKTRLRFLFRLENVEIAMRPFAKLIRTAIREGVKQTSDNIRDILEAEQTPACKAHSNQKPMTAR